jgi:hypothetical protein
MKIIELVESEFFCYEDYVTLKVRAVVDEVKLVRNHNWIEPAEYAPALCRTEVRLYDYNGDLTDEKSIIDFLEENDPQWILDYDDWIDEEL